MFSNFSLYLDRLIKSPALVILIVAINFSFGLIGQPTVDDPFHTGEWLASATNLLFGDLSAYKSLQIHGLNDVLPALLTQYIWGPDHHFVPTLAFIVLLISALMRYYSQHCFRLLARTRTATSIF